LNPEALWGMIPWVFFVCYLLWRRYRWPEWFHWRRFLLSTLAFGFCIFGLCRPQGGTRTSQPEPVTANIFVALDISNSMLADDTLPNRLQFSVLLLEKTLEQLTKPRVALFPFASSGFLQLPLTTDTFALADSLLSVDPSLTSHQGTDFNETLNNLMTTIRRIETQSSDKLETWSTPRVLLISDGEMHGQFDTATLAQYRQKDIPIFTVGVGTPDGSTIPFPSAPMRDPQTGSIIKTKLNAPLLREISLKTGGSYFSGTYENIPLLAQQLNQSLSAGRTSSQFKLEREFFPILFAIALILFAIEFSYGRWHYTIKTIALFFFFGSFSFVAWAEDDQIRATEAYNQGLEQVKKKDFQKAVELFEESSLVLQNPNARKQALFNLGNSFLRMGDPEQALESYQKAYKTNAADESFNAQANTMISENMALAAQILEAMKKAQSQQQQSGNSDGKQDDPGNDPKGPKQFQGEPLTEEQKQKLFDLISSEEKQTLKRLRGQQNPSRNKTGTPW
ncbi:MAG: VWA domain-containing protein, partial [Proteobacteria bacterium]|nr:VWA domain-containing protein [Pseudomonadota bacterium]